MVNISVFGFYGSGSSAVIDFLREFDNVGVALDKNHHGVIRPYEHFPFISSGGLFECCTLLTSINSIYNSDKIINNFINCNKRLNNNDFGSFGSYKWLVGDEFMKATYQFLDDIGAKKAGGSTSEHKVKVRFSLIMCALQLAAKIVYKRPVYKWGKKNITDKDPTYYAMPEENVVYESARKFINSYFHMCEQQNKDIMIYDQLLCPQHTVLFEKYFDDNFKAISVERDPRDIYFLSKYFWSKPPYSITGAPLPVDVDEFCEYWLENLNYKRDVKNLLIIKFEDLVYKYAETTETIMDYLGIDRKHHTDKLKFFNPEYSIKNTQSFLMNKNAENEIKVIENKLGEYLYDFPYDIQTSFSEMFDDTKEAVDKFKEKK